MFSKGLTEDTENKTGKTNVYYQFHVIRNKAFLTLY